MKIFEVLNEGVISAYEDLGRFGYDDKGVANSGISDELSYHLTNKLLNNSANTTVIEITIGRLKLKALGNTKVAIGGANMRVKLNGTIQKNWSSFPVKKGDILEFGYAIDGQLGYLSIKGGFDAPLILGSSSVSRYLGKPLKKGDILFAKEEYFDTRKSYLSHKIIPNLKYKKLTLRYVKGYQHKWFDIEKFNSLTFKVSNRYNKMGYQLDGAKIEPKHSTLISEAISYGAIQITVAGYPIVLLKDRQTIGGYPKIGSVLPMDCFKLSQCGANTAITFEEVGLEYAQQEVKRFYNELKYL